MRPEFKYGLITGVGICLWIVTEYCLGLHTTHLEIGESTGYFSNLIPLATLFLLLRQKQAAAYDGRLTLGQGIASGLVASFLGALIVYAFMLGYNQWINPDWLDNALAAKVALMRAHGIGEVEIRREITFYRQANSPVGLITTTLLGLTVMGGTLSLILTLLLRLRPRPNRT
jgi:hypothetical protein